MQEEFNQLPQIDSRLRKNILRMPEAVFQASGIVINGRRIKSFVFTTDLAIIRNCDADAVFAVYPFTPQQAISDAIIKASYIPVFCGVGGGDDEGHAHGIFGKGRRIAGCDGRSSERADLGPQPSCGIKKRSISPSLPPLPERTPTLPCV